ncbi:RING finger protein 6 Mel18 and Bmi1-like [Takifugu flavidus]|uniref:RING finger protein 6 Mel18 and Bmi1-like n=1 Tax=Takifugu flavidus TaxID=433684 RepID=A0A5C6PIF2_9TELE|nr:RING finger protein 6 Mel18 and Bmi1-like [Takifugu flavidus]
MLDIHHFSTLLGVSVLPPDRASPSGLQVDMACGEHLLDHCQSLKDIKKIAGKEAYQDGLLVLHFALVLPSET